MAVFVSFAEVLVVEIGGCMSHIARVLGACGVLWWAMLKQRVGMQW